MKNKGEGGGRKRRVRGERGRGVGGGGRGGQGRMGRRNLIRMTSGFSLFSYF